MSGELKEVCGATFARFIEKEQIDELVSFYKQNEQSITHDSKAYILSYAVNYYLIVKNNKKGYALLTKLLEGTGIDVNIRDNQSNSLMVLVARSGNEKLFKYFVSHGAEINNIDAYNNNALEYASDSGNYDFLGFVLTLIKDQEERQGRIDKLLLHAACNNNIELVKFCLRNGADVNYSDHDKDTALIAAVLNNNLLMIKILVAHKAALSPKNIKNNDSLQLAVYLKYHETIKYFIEQYKKEDVPLEEWIEVLKFAIKYNHSDIVSNLIKKNLVKVDELLESKTTPLMLAASLDRVEIVKLLLSKGADIKHVNEVGFTVLAFAARQGSVKSVEVLLSYGMIDVNCQIKNTMTALIWAAHAKPEQLDIQGPVDPMEIKQKMFDTVSLLLENGADVNAIGKDGITALITAVNKKDNLEIIELLLKYKADVNAKDNGGITALMVAVFKDQEDAFKLLINYGADVDARSNEGSSIADFASNNPNEIYLSLIRWAILNRVISEKAKKIQNSNIISNKELVVVEKVTEAVVPDQSSEEGLIEFEQNLKKILDKKANKTQVKQLIELMSVEGNLEKFEAVITNFKSEDILRIVQKLAAQEELLQSLFKIRPVKYHIISLINSREGLGKISGILEYMRYCEKDDLIKLLDEYLSTHLSIDPGLMSVWQSNVLTKINQFNQKELIFILEKLVLTACDDVNMFKIIFEKLSANLNELDPNQFLNIIFLCDTLQRSNIYSCKSFLYELLHVAKYHLDKFDSETLVDFQYYVSNLPFNEKTKDRLAVGEIVKLIDNKWTREAEESLASESDFVVKYPDLTMFLDRSIFAIKSFIEEGGLLGSCAAIYSQLTQGWAINRIPKALYVSVLDLYSQIKNYQDNINHEDNALSKLYDLLLALNIQFENTGGFYGPTYYPGYPVPNPDDYSGGGGGDVGVVGAGNNYLPDSSVVINIPVVMGANFTEEAYDKYA